MIEQNNKIIEFFMPMKKVPTTTHQQKGVRIINKGGKNVPIFYDTPDIKKARADFKRGLIPHVPEVPLTPPIRMTTKWLYKKRKKDMHGTYKITKPDNDNAIKLLKDEMEALGFFKDDAHVASSITEKFYADVPGIYVRVEEIPSEGVTP